MPQTPPLAPLEALETVDGYRQLFTDPVFWRPYVLEVCRRHKLHPGANVRMGVPGTYPTFIIDNEYVVKFFGRLFDGQHSFTSEYQANQIASLAKFPAPPLLLQGSLFENAVWNWPYLVFEYLPSVSIGEVYERVCFEDLRVLAQDLGRTTRRLHDLSLNNLQLIGDGQPFPPDWNVYLQFLNAQYHRSLNAPRLLPDHLQEQVQNYLLSPQELIDFNLPPHLIHADLTRDHILGKLADGRWQTLGIIDWGDAMIGNLIYELLALHLDLFHNDKRLLAAYLDAYGLQESARCKLPRQAMSLALTHRFNILDFAFRNFPYLREIGTLAELADILWRV